VQVEKAYESGVSGVPHFIIGGKAHVSGAQESATFLDIFNSIAAQPQ
jgi:predicted DsbA family dithiol-disulfide isomerase